MRTLNTVLVKLAIRVFLIAIAFFSLSIAAPVPSEYLVLFGAGMLLFVLAVSLRRLLKIDARIIFTPVFWVLIAYTVYIGFGSIIPVISTTPTFQYLFASYAFNTEEQIFLFLLYATSLSILLVSIAFFNSVLYRFTRDDKQFHNTNGLAALRTYALLFGVPGFLIRYFLVIPASLGIADSPSGIIVALSSLFYASLLLFSAYSIKAQKSRNIIFLFLVILFDAGVSVLTFSKLEVLQLFLFVYLGFWLGGVSRSINLLMGCFCIVAYMILQPIVIDGRSALLSISGSHYRGNLSERIDALGIGLSGTSDLPFSASNSDTPNLALVRLTYVPSDTFVIHQYNIGEYGSTYSLIPILLIPRILWPDKPELNRSGTELFSAMTGAVSGSSTGITIPAEAYWNLGPLGVLIVMIAYGFIISSFTRFSLIYLERREWLYTPVILVGIYIGMRLDGFLATDIIGRAVIGIALFFLLYFIRRIFRLLAL